MNNEQCNMNHWHHLKCISWSAILVGALVGIGLSFLLSLFSVAIDLSVVKTTQEGLVSFAVGGFIALLITAIIAKFMGGFVAGYLGRPFCIKRNFGVIYGFTTWCLALVLTALLIGPMTRYVTTYSHFVTSPSAVVVESNNQIQAAKTSIDSEVVVVNPQTALHTIGWGTFIIFILFFVGAVSSCFGGHYGMEHRSRHDACDPDNK